jgi:hypothetical protein
VNLFDNKPQDSKSLYPQAISTGKKLTTVSKLLRDADAEHLATGLIDALQDGYVLAQATRDVDDMGAAIDMALNRIRGFRRGGRTPLTSGGMFSHRCLRPPGHGVTDGIDTGRDSIETEEVVS